MKRKWWILAIIIILISIIAISITINITKNEDNKQIREEEIKAYKEGKIDILVVDNMLLTGFDAPRLKKLYLGRVIRAHNLLQALTRVNRPYKNFRYGYVVDFADIRDEFDKQIKYILMNCKKN